MIFVLYGMVFIILGITYYLEKAISFYIFGNHC